MAEPIWAPSADRVTRANVTRFRRMVNEQLAPGVTDFQSLYEWSVERPEQFWPAVWGFCGVVASTPAAAALEDGDRMPGAHWFPGARLNFAENLLRYRDKTEAIVFWNETGRVRSLTYAELHEQVRRLALTLREWGLVAGDRVAGYLPNLPETVISMLAATSIGGIWSSCSPDFGLQGVLDRFGQIAPRFLVTATGYQYTGKRFNYLDKIRSLSASLPSLERSIVVPYLDRPAGSDLPPRSVLWDEALSTGSGELRFEQVRFEHPVYILFSSGTTGKPKCIVHGAGGTLLQHLKEHALHTDVKRGDRMIYFTTCGWMMWNWLVSGLASGATIVLYDGSPMSPSRAALFDLAEAERINIFGTSAKYISALEKAGIHPRRTHDLGPLRTILSTGSPLVAEGFDYVYESIKDDVCLSSISGGTDIVSCFALGNPAGAVYRGELQTRGLGMAVKIFDENQRPVIGRKGELVCTKPFPSMPVRFWDDPDGEKYRRAYFSHYPGVWRHGDWAELTETGGVVIYGRSDAVLNPGGVRIGTAEIYRIVEKFTEVAESMVIGQDWNDDVRVILFVKLAPGAELTPQLVGDIRRRIREEASPRHSPAKVIAVADIPRTINNKITELAVRDIIHGRSVRNTEALLNPEALELFRDLPDLKT